MRIVGNQNRSEFEPDPVKAYRRGLVLDAMMRGTLPPYPRGVTRGTHEYFNRIGPGWFEPAVDGDVENIRVADELLVDLLFSANGETYESVQPYLCA